MATRWFTGKGDKGTTGILSARRVSKSDKLIEAIGTLDELNSAIGVALSHLDDSIVARQLRDIQNDLFILGANLASSNEKAQDDGAAAQPASDKKMEEAQIKRESLERLESNIAQMDKAIPELKQFVLPGGTAAGAQLQMARSIARRAERNVIEAGKEYKIDDEAIAYLNRLSSYLFAAALYVNHNSGVKESHPTY